MQFMGLCDGRTYDEQQVKYFVESLVAQNSETPLKELTLIILKDDNAVGFVSLSKFDEEIPDIACCIIPSMQGKGIASSLESALQLSAYLGVEALGALAHQQNVVSKRVLEKTGFSYVGQEYVQECDILMDRYVIKNIKKRLQIV
jgi:RimJ/RimL family protein N-acetyltransferase